MTNTKVWYSEKHSVLIYSISDWYYKGCYINVIAQVFLVDLFILTKCSERIQTLCPTISYPFVFVRYNNNCLFLNVATI